MGGGGERERERETPPATSMALLSGWLYEPRPPDARVMDALPGGSRSRSRERERGCPVMVAAPDVCAHGCVLVCARATRRRDRIMIPDYPIKSNSPDASETDKSSARLPTTRDATPSSSLPRSTAALSCRRRRCASIPLLCSPSCFARRARRAGSLRPRSCRRHRLRPSRRGTTRRGGSSTIHQATTLRRSAAAAAAASWRDGARPSAGGV